MIIHDSFQSELGLLNLLQHNAMTSVSRDRFFKSLFSGNFSDASNRAVLVLLAQQGESADTLLAAWNAIRFAEKTKVSFKKSCLDTCGTGGDGSDSINLSTLSSLVMAAAGITVLKHGNRAITSKCGSSDLMHAFGYNLDQSSSRVLSAAHKCHMGYFHAPVVHPVYAKFQHIRRSVKVRTFFNLLGPVLNPVAVDYQLLGVAENHLLEVYQQLLPKIGRKRALIFMGPEGMDEITSLGVSHGVYLCGFKSKRWSLNPHDLGFKKGLKGDLKITSIQHAKKKAVDILKNKKSGTTRDSVLLSAAVGISIAENELNIKKCLTKAIVALDSGKAWKILNEMVRMSQL